MGASVFAPDPLAPGGGFRLRYDGEDSIIFSGEPQPLAVKLVRRNGPPARTSPLLVETLLWPDLLVAGEQFVTSGRHVLPMVGAVDFEPDDLLGVAHAPLMRASVDVFQRTDSAPALSQSTDVPEIATVSETCLTAALATASTSPFLPERLIPEQWVSSIRV